MNTEMQEAGVIGMESMVVASSELVAANLDGEVVILGFRAGCYYSLDQVGAFVWDLLQTPRTVTTLRDAILNEYDIDPAQCETDLLRLLHELAAKDLLQIQVQ